MTLESDIVELHEEDHAVERLLNLAHQHAWLPADLPWPEEPAWAALELEISDASSLLSRLPQFRRMSGPQREALKRSELASHLGTLAFGEGRAVTLAGDTVILSNPEDGLARWFLGTLLADEAKHFLVLRQYVDEVLQRRVYPHAPLEGVFQQLAAEKDYALNLLVGQVVLEGAAASLLSSLLLGTREPLLRELLKRIGRDEARHMRFAHLAFVHSEDLTPARRRRMEEILFEAAYAALASLVSERSWEEFDLPRARARAVTLEALRQRGVLTYYARVLARQLAQRGFPAEELGHTLETRLLQRLKEAP